VSLNTVLAHIVHNDDGSAVGVWGPFTLRSAFQPIFTFKNGKLTVSAFEGLLRPFREGKPVPPAGFFAAVPSIDRLSIETVTRTLHMVNAAVFLPADTSLFINIDPSVFVDRRIAETALADMRLVLSQAGIDPKRLVCELIENKSGSEETLFRFVSSLRASGFRIAVDDYGAEDSDISRIKALKPDIVKFDAQWITRLMESGPGYGLLATMVNMFNQQGIVTVFEGLEHNWQLELAERAGAIMVQGYVLARPEVVPTDFASLLPDMLPARVPPQRPTVMAAVHDTYAGAPRRTRQFGRRAAR